MPHARSTGWRAFMPVARLLKTRLTSTFFLFMALQISSCSTEDIVGSIVSSTNSDNSSEPQAVADINQLIIGGVDTGSIVEDDAPDGDNMLKIASKLDIANNDNGEITFVAETIEGLYGNLTIDENGNWEYAADNSQDTIQNLNSGNTLTDELIVSSSDDAVHTIVITIVGIDEVATPNQAAIITGVSSGSVVEDNDPDGDNLLEISGKLNITDPDIGEAAFITNVTIGSYGKLTINAAGNWGYAANNNQSAIQNLNNAASLTDQFTVRSIDNTAKTITITIKGIDEVNSPAVITGTSSGSVTEDVDPDNDNLLEVSGKLNITDSDAGEAAFIAKTVTSSYGKLTINTSGNWNYSTNNSQSVIQGLATGSKLVDKLTISSIDGTKRTITITINGANEPVPVAGGNINLSWTAPSQREDNTGLLLSEISGYKIYYGTKSGAYTSNVKVNDSTATGYTFTGFNPGTYYFVVTTLDTDNRESKNSTEVTFVN